MIALTAFNSKGEKNIKLPKKRAFSESKRSIPELLAIL